MPEGEPVPVEAPPGGTGTGGTGTESGGWVDSHHHLWRPDPRRYPWLAGPGLAALNRPFGRADLAAAAAGTGIGAAVVVQAADEVTETVDLLALAGSAGGRGVRTGPGAPRVVAVVGWADLRDPGAPAWLDRLRAAPGGARLAGVRASLRGVPDPGWLAGPGPAAALRHLAARGLSLDLLAGPPALTAAGTAAAGHPGLRVILDHAGHPPLADRTALGAWAASVRRFARHPNTAVKFSGVWTRAPGARWDPGDLRPVAETLLEAFGPGRVMFGSDWPVCLLSASYPEVVAAARAALGLAGADEQRVFGGNARAWYRLPSG